MIQKALNMGQHLPSLAEQTAAPKRSSAEQFVSAVGKLHRSLVASQWLSAEELRAKQLEQLDALLRHAFEHVPYYRQRYASLLNTSNVTWDQFSRLPVLERSEYQWEQANFLAEKLPANTSLTGIGRSSGTTATPVSIQRTNQTDIAWSANAMRELEWNQLHPTGRVAVIRTAVGSDRETEMTSWGPPYNLFLETGPAHGLSIAASYDEQREWLERINPDYIFSTGSNLAGLFLSAGRLPSLPKLRAIRSFASDLPVARRLQIESLLGVPVWDLYTCEEAGYITSECPEQRTQHVYAENVLVEVLDDENRPCPIGRPGRVVLTTLLNYANPLIRYELGDQAALGPLCTCGRGLPTLSTICGKQQPRFRLPGGGGKASNLLAVLNSVEELAQYQVIQHSPREITVRLVPGRGWRPGSSRDIARLIDEFFEVSDPAQLHVQWDICERIKPNHAGKVLSMIVAPTLALTANSNVAEVAKTFENSVAGKSTKTKLLTSSATRKTLHDSLAESQWWSAEQLRAHQLELLSDLLQHCQQHVPYYREHWRQEGTVTTFDQLPILQRSVYHAQRTNFLAERLPEGTWLTGVARTSGSTGIPIAIQRTNLADDAWNANALRELDWAGIDCSGTLASIRYQVGPSGQVALPTWGPPYDSLKPTGRAHGLTIARSIAEQRAWLEQVDPHVILTTASNLGALFLAEGDFPELKHLRAIRCIGGETSAELRTRIETQHGVPVWDVYSCEEAGFLGVQCEQREQYHVQAESVLLEVLDQHGQACQPGETGRVVITTLNNYANPLIRYALGDLATVGEPCCCGRGLPTLRRISGRQRTPFQLPCGGWKNTQLLSEPLAKVRGLAQFQCIQQDAGNVLVRLVPGHDWSSATQGDVAKIIKGFFQPNPTPRLNVQWQLCQRIEPDASGKYHPFVTHCVSGQALADC